MNYFISGGCKNGKSFHAQTIARDMSLANHCKLYYIATMIPHDEEDLARIQRHLKEREGWGFETIEQGKNLTEILKDPMVDKDGVFLLDSLTALLSNEMFDEQGEFDESAAGRVGRDAVDFAKATGNTVFVSDYLYGDQDNYSEFTEQYREGLASVDRAVAGVCDKVLEVCYGIVEEWK